MARPIHPHPPLNGLVLIKRNFFYAASLIRPGPIYKVGYQRIYVHLLSLLI